jgi:hypothetical protein
MHRLRLLVLLAGLACSTFGWCAQPACTSEPRAKWLTREAVRAKVEAQGYKVVDIDVENACYVVEVRDKNGKEIDLHLDPVTGKIVRQEEDS